VAFLEDRALRQIHLIHHEIGLIEVEDIEPAANGGQFGQKAADQAIGLLPQPQVQTSRLDLPVFDWGFRCDGAAPDQLNNILVGENSLRGPGPFHR
jgi:hypothetical protein